MGRRAPFNENGNLHRSPRWHGGGTLPTPVSSDAKATRILARTFFNQLRSSGYTPTQVIAVATELIELVTCDLREADKVSLENAESEESRPVA
jgi:hypothetical protein